MQQIGVISDTHGLLRDEAMAALEGSELIVHAGDVGGPEILEDLERIAPVRAVRGNTDRGSWAEALPRTDVVSLESVDAYVIHDVEELDLEPGASGFGVVIYGHSHRPAMDWKGNVLFFNPGAAGHRRFTLPVTVGRLTLPGDGSVRPEILDLGVDR